MLPKTHSKPYLRRPPFSALALAGAMSASVVLTGCGRAEETPVSAPTAEAPREDNAPREDVPREDNAMFQSDVQTSPGRPRAGEPVTITFTVRDGAGRPVPELAISHEKPMHVMVVSKDLRHFAHVHPVEEGDSFRLEHTFEEGGEYFIVVDYQQPGRGQVVDRHRVRVEGPARASAPLAESSRTQRADGLELTLHSDGAIRAGEGAMLHFDATDVATGQPATDLEPYLGAKAHFMVLSADGEDYVHVHALEGGPASRVSAHAVFPRPGLYKLWAQLQRRGEVVTVPFVLRVGAAAHDAAPGSAPDASGEHGGHGHHAAHPPH